MVGAFDLVIFLFPTSLKVGVYNEWRDGVVESKASVYLNGTAHI